MAHLSARADTAYDNAYHHKLRGRLWGALEGTEYDERHDSSEPPGFAYSNPFPPYDMDEGDERKLLVTAADEELLTHVARDLQAERDLNIGEMPFRVENVTALEPSDCSTTTEYPCMSSAGRTITVGRTCPSASTSRAILS